MRGGRVRNPATTSPHLFPVGQKGVSPSFPSCAWECRGAKLDFAHSTDAKHSFADRRYQAQLGNEERKKSLLAAFSIRLAFLPLVPKLRRLSQNSCCFVICMVVEEAS